MSAMPTPFPIPAEAAAIADLHERGRELFNADFNLCRRLLSRSSLTSLDFPSSLETAETLEVSGFDPSLMSMGSTTIDWRFSSTSLTSRL